MCINFQQNRFSRSVNTVSHKLISKKFTSCTNLQLAIRLFNNHAFLTCTTPRPILRPNLRSICQLDLKLPQKETIF